MNESRRTRTQPVGLSAGSVGLTLAWLGGAAIARLTGATPVVIMLAVMAMAAIVATAESLWSLRRVHVDNITLPAMSTQGETIPLVIDIRSPRPIWVEVVHECMTVACGWSDPRSDRFEAEAGFARRGVVREVHVHIRTGGSLGLFWWQRRHHVDIGEHHVAAAVGSEDAPVEQRALAADGEFGGAPGAVSGELDGIRPWREGDSERWVHWSSSMRSGELMVFDRRRPSENERIIRPRVGTDDPDAEAGAARRSLERSIALGARTLVAVGDAEPVEIVGPDAAARWSASVDLGAVEQPSRRWWHRSWTAEPNAPASVWARRWSAVATFVSLAMLIGALGLEPLLLIPIAVTVSLAAAVSGRSLVTGEPPSAFVRSAVGLGALVGLAMVLVSSGQLDGLLTFLRGPLPQVLIILILIHGFECRDRRTLRVGVGISSVVVMYAAAFRVDDRLIWWLAAWIMTAGASLAALARPAGSPHFRLPTLSSPTGGWVHRVAFVGATLSVTVAVLAVVPVPDGPADLTLPTVIEGADPIGQPGGLAGPDGDLSDDRATAEPGTDRAPAGQAGGYTGFASSMDTSVRGELSDEVVMRVRAPAADFWRGQTFTEFDGRRWYADTEAGLLQQGPNIDIPASFGDTAADDSLAYDELVQTFHLEVDMPNLLFHAYRPTSVVLDSNLWSRADGALRASTTLPAGSVYTVVSTRPVVDAAVLRSRGHVDERLNERGRAAFQRHLTVPLSTSPETIALANQLAAGAESTYDVVRAYETWMNANVEYDLNAPLPDPGEDAVHDFLFDTQLGFCEQIASAMTVMLRSQGIPARLAAGYTSGTRDTVSGVFEVRASDAHAWVEVWFPEVGWQAFDPTAAVPLSAESQVGSVGADLTSGLADFVGDNIRPVVFAVVAAMVAIGGWRILSGLRLRRRRGRWGSLQDRFADRAAQRGARTGATNRELADAWTAADDAEVARLVAARLDRAAFAPDFGDDDEAYADTRRLVDALPRTDRR